MNWKFWKRRKCANCLALEMSRVACINSLNRALVELSASRAALKFKDRRPGEQPTEAQIVSALVLVDEETPLWRAVHRLIDLVETDQKTAVCLAVQTSEERHYNAGRLAMCEDLRTSLLQKWTEARRSNDEAQRP